MRDWRGVLPSAGDAACQRHTHTHTHTHTHAAGLAMHAHGNPHPHHHHHRQVQGHAEQPTAVHSRLRCPLPGHHRRRDEAGKACRVPCRLQLGCSAARFRVVCALCSEAHTLLWALPTPCDRLRVCPSPAALVCVSPSLCLGWSVAAAAGAQRVLPGQLPHQRPHLSRPRGQALGQLAGPPLRRR
jgi:hypothetical protein